MNKILCLVITGLMLSGCMFRTHKADIVQGNVIGDAEVHQLRVGMGESEVKNLLGTPVLINVFTPNKTVYLYTFQEGYGSMKKKSVTLTVVNGRVTDIQVTPYS